MRQRILGMIMAGGKGKRLTPLTRDRAKPAVYVWGKYRIIDASLNSIGRCCEKTYVLPQYQAASLVEHVEQAHIRQGRPYSLLSSRETSTRQWYEGTADCVRQNIDRMGIYNRIAIGAGDHLCTFDFGNVVDSHNKENGKGKSRALTVMVIEKQLKPEDFQKSQYRFGVFQVDKNGKAEAFLEKVENPPEIPGKPGFVYASMGIYLFETEALVDSLKKEYGENGGLGNDFGKEIIPGMIKNKMPVFVHVHNTETDGPWEDVGTLNALHKANMDIVSENPRFKLKALLDEERPIRTLGDDFPPSRVRTGPYGNFSAFSEGSEINGVSDQSVFSQKVYVGKKSRLERCVVFPDVKIGENVFIRNTFIDRLNNIPSGVQIGYDLEHDRELGLHVDPSGIVVVPKNHFQ